MKKLFYSIPFSLFLFLSISLSAQITSSSQWTWMKGDNTINAPGVYGTKGTPASANKPEARDLSVSWTDAAGKFWLFGGNASRTGRLNDLWKYDPTTNLWTWVNGDNTKDNTGVYGTRGTAASTNKPGARDGSISWVDASGNLWLFGGAGYGASAFGRLNDLWKYDPITNQWTWVNGDNGVNIDGVYGTQGIAASTNKPGGRDNSISWKDASGNLWLFGGYVQAFFIGRLNDLWKYDPISNLWTWMKGSNTIGLNSGVYGTQGTPASANTPGARDSSASWTDASGNFWLFGGYGNAAANGFGNLNDLWKYDPIINQWTWVKGDNVADNTGVYGTQGTAGSGNKPGARRLPVSWTDASGSLWLFGGQGYAGSGGIGYLNDLWKYDRTSNQWTWVKGDNTTNNTGVYGTQGTAASVNKPGARNHSISWKDISGNFWLFGGEGYDASGSNGFLNDLWKLSNVSVLPLIVNSIRAYQQSNNIAVEWKAENESGIKQYEVEKSIDGYIFTKVALQAAGNNMSSVNYSWLDMNIQTGNNFYRIRSVSINGETKYSQIVKVALGKSSPAYQVYPNPVTNGVIQLQFINQPKGVYLVRLLNALGQVIRVNQIAHEAGSNTETVKPGGQIVKGNYFLEVTAPDKSRQSMKITF